MQKQSGNFLLQALLALTLVFAFIPFIVGKIASRDASAQMYAITSQIETAYTAARIYLREVKDELPYKKQELAKDKFVDVLENYGLPLGFNPRTAFGQEISLIIDKNEDGIISYLQISGGNLSKLQMAEMARRIGFYATINAKVINVMIPLDNMYSDIVSRKETNEGVGFLSDLDINENSVNNTGVLFARNGKFESAEFNSLVLYGLETSGSYKNDISDLYARKSIFQSADGGAALTLSRADLVVGDALLRTIAKYGNAGTFESNSASVYDFSMAEGRTSFSGPAEWNVRGNVKSDNFSFTVDRLDVGGYIDASRGQDVYVEPTTLSYVSNVGIEAKNVFAANITLRDQTSYGLLTGRTGVAIIDIRPAGTSVLPDVYVENINNDSFDIISDAKDTEGKMVKCKEIIESLDEKYNSKSLAQNIICQYVFWQRLESRINIKQCLQSGQSDCM